MPGVKIGAGAVVGPGQNVFRDVADGESLLPERGR
jgi:acetyltransferase-like isoleucine patch superfamily enzyme